MLPPCHSCDILSGSPEVQGGLGGISAHTGTLSPSASRKLSTVPRDLLGRARDGWHKRAENQSRHLPASSLTS